MRLGHVFGGDVRQVIFFLQGFFGRTQGDIGWNNEVESTESSKEMGDLSVDLIKTQWIPQGDWVT